MTTAYGTRVQGCQFCDSKALIVDRSVHAAGARRGSFSFSSSP